MIMVKINYPPPPPPLISKDPRREALDIQQKVFYDKMTPHERDFALNILDGMTPREAYCASEYRPSVLTINPAEYRRMLSEETIQQFLKAVRGHAELDKRIMSREEALESLTNMARGSLLDVIKLKTITTDEGTNYTTFSLKNPDEIDEYKFQNVSEISHTDNGIKVKTYNRREAIADVRKMQGWDKPKAVQVDIGERTLEALDTEKYKEARKEMLEEDDV